MGKKKAQGNGFGKEAIHLLKNWADKNLQYEYLLYSADRRNNPSQKIAESLGGKVFREHQIINQSGNLLDLQDKRERESQRGLPVGRGV